MLAVPRARPPPARALGHPGRESSSEATTWWPRGRDRVPSRTVRRVAHQARAASMNTGSQTAARKGRVRGPHIRVVQKSLTGPRIAWPYVANRKHGRSLTCCQSRHCRPWPHVAGPARGPSATPLCQAATPRTMTEKRPHEAAPTGGLIRPGGVSGVWRILVRLRGMRRAG